MLKQLWADEGGAIISAELVLLMTILCLVVVAGTSCRAAELSARSIRITSFALCGFANFGSLAIVLGGLGGMVPERRKDLARLGLRSILAGSLATFLTGTIAGLVGP